MVKGLDIWQKHFADFTDNYVLIGGAACNVFEEEYSQNPRATKDLDVILVVEALTADFGRKFWEFIREGRYTFRQRGENKHEYYRFMNPENSEYPKQVELFARKAGLLSLPADSRLEPIHIEDDLSSLSAILMDDNYYNFTIEHSIIQDGIHLANIEALVCLKAKAYVDLVSRKANGEQVDSRDLEKHKKDVMRLAAMIIEGDRYELPEALKNDVSTFCDIVASELPNADFMKSVGLKDVDCNLLMETIKNSML